jgi:hypothetical protein
MTLSKPWKITVGLATLWLVLYPLLFFAVWLIMFIGMPISGIIASSAEGNLPMFIAPFFMLPFFCIFPLHFLTIFIALGLMAFYLIHVIKNTKANDTVRIILGVGCFFMPFIAMPVYYYAYIWHDEPPAWATARSDGDAP